MAEDMGMSEFDTRFESWAAEFEESPEARPFAAKVRGEAQDLLAEFLGGACEGGTDPGQIGEAEVKKGLMDRVAAMPLDPAVRAEAPRLVAAYLEFLAREGRVANGRHLANYAMALAKSFPKHGSPSGIAPIHREAPKLGLNDPCPCGSGRKWKKCCRKSMGAG
jgi:hypothetical protein